MNQRPSEFIVSACDGKKSFDTATLAKAVAKRMRQNGKPVQHYRCPVCRRWHIGKDSQK